MGIATPDDVIHDFGDPEEACLSAAFVYQHRNDRRSNGRKALENNKELNSSGAFTGMIRDQEKDEAGTTLKERVV